MYRIYLLYTSLLFRVFDIKANDNLYFFIFCFSRDTLKYIYTISAIPTAARAFGETNDEFSIYICIDTTALL